MKWGKKTTLSDNKGNDVPDLFYHMEPHTTLTSTSLKVSEMGERQFIGFSASSINSLCGTLERMLFLAMTKPFIGFNFKIKPSHFQSLKVNSK